MQNDGDRPKRSKYGNKKTMVDGITFASKKEAMHYVYLKVLETNGEIKNLERQVRFTFPAGTGIIRHVKSKRPVMYISDFRYIGSDGSVHVVDVKGMRTAEFKLKAALMLHLNNIQVEEV